MNQWSTLARAKMTDGMLRSLWALVFLVLAALPFTAPFQTCDTTDDLSPVAVVAPLTDENDSGSLIAPLVTKTGRLTIALPMGVTASSFTPVMFPTPFTAALHLASPFTALPTVLRV